MHRYTWFALTLVLTIAVSSRADVLYNNFGPGDAYTTGIGFSVFNHPTEKYDVALPFTVSGSMSYTLSSIELPITNSGFSNLPIDDLSVSIRTDAGGTPSNTIVENFTLTLADNSPPAIRTFTSATHPTLQAGTTYWVFADAITVNAQFVWFLSPDGLAPRITLQRTNGGPWAIKPEGNAALRVTAVLVPEPSTLAMLLAALPLAYLAYRRRCTEPPTC